MGRRVPLLQRARRPVGADQPGRAGVLRRCRTSRGRSSTRCPTSRRPAGRRSTGAGEAVGGAGRRGGATRRGVARVRDFRAQGQNAAVPRGRFAGQARAPSAGPSRTRAARRGVDSSVPSGFREPVLPSTPTRRARSCPARSHTSTSCQAFSARKRFPGGRAVLASDSSLSRASRRPGLPSRSTMSKKHLDHRLVAQEYLLEPIHLSACSTRRRSGSRQTIAFACGRWSRTSL